MSAPDPVFAKDVPLHHQIHSLVRAAILDGLYVGREDFPGEIELANRFAVSVITSRAVLKRLVAEGLIERGRGRRPRAIFVPPAGDSGRILPSTESGPALGQEVYRYEILRITEAVAPWQACRTFGLPPGSVLWQCLKLRSFAGRPHSVTLSVQPLEIGRRHESTDIARMQVPKLLKRIGYPVLQIDRTVSIARPPPDVRVHLGTTVWEALLMMTTTQRSRDRRPVDWTRIFYHPDLEQQLDTVAWETGL